MRTEPLVPAEALAAIRAPFLASGAEIIDAPILQPLGLLLDLAGEALRARLFVVQAEGGSEDCLRPDFTVPVARAHLDNGAADGRYLYEGKAFRAALSEADGPEEFRQIGVELLRATDPRPAAADAEIAALAWSSAVAGGRKDLTLWLGDVGLFSTFVDSLGLGEALAVRLKRAAARPRLLQAELARAGARTAPETEASRLADLLAGLSETDAAGVLAEIWALAGVEPVGGRGAADIARRLIARAEAVRALALSVEQGAAIGAFLAIEDAPAPALAAVADLAGGKALKAALKGWAERLDLLTHSGVPAQNLRFATALGHAFDYYDGLTFEVRSAALAAAAPVAVGGRYDGLLARMGGAAGSRAVGCMVRPWRAYAGGQS